MSVRDVCVCDLQFGMRSGGGSKASFSAFVDPRVYGTSPTEDDEKSSAAGTLPETLPPHPPTLRPTMLVILSLLSLCVYRLNVNMIWINCPALPQQEVFEKSV